MVEDESAAVDMPDETDHDGDSGASKSRCVS